jgi:hypothetical protein
MPTVNRDRSQLFKVISGVTHYMGKEGSESEAGTLYVGSILVATVESNERRTLRGRRVPVIRFTVGADGKGQYWLPRNEFTAALKRSSNGSRPMCPF